MPINRYQRAPKLRLGKFYGTWDACYIISVAVASGKISWKGHVTVEAERLDIIAGDMYGDGTLWWVIAGASGIGWGLQVPPGIYLKIPTDIGQIQALLG
tara:strand:+ start:249 stop:545 length:297 start_codon:yes stop_codon:yes gene_type:complete